MMTLSRKLWLTGALVISLLGQTNRASAHAISIGFQNAGPGAVTIWLGTYAHSGHHLEGALKLEGVLGTVFGPSTLPFDMLTPDGIANKPAGLINGTTNFFAQGSIGSNLPLINYNPFTGVVNAQNPSGFNLPEDHWQGRTFTGLVPGDYKFTYVPIGNPSQEWTPWNDSLNGTFNLTGVINNGVPEPSSLAIFGVASMGLGVLRRSRR